MACEHHFKDDKEEQARLGKGYEPIDCETIAIPIICEKCGYKMWEYYTFSHDKKREC